MSMMHMPWVIVTLILFLVVVGGGAFIAVRMLGAKAVEGDHPRR
ncbi:MAG: hypothetical protein WBQ50_08195 [Nocardioides sp.]